MRLARNRAATAVALLLAGVSLTGCMTVNSKKAGYAGNVPDFARKDVASYVADRNAILLEFALLGGLTAIPENEGEWRPVVDGGMQYVDVRCARFMDSLFWLNRARETASNQIQYASAAVSAALAIANATKNLLGIAPLGFGFADQTVNNLGQGLLYNLDPGVVAGLVARQQGTYRDAIKNSDYTNRAAALAAIQQYASLCLPVSIEGEVGRAIANSEFKRVDYRTPPQRDDPPPEPPATATQPDGQAPPPPPSGEQNVVPVLEQRQPE